MIRQLKLHDKLRIPAKLRAMALDLTDIDFAQRELDDPVLSIARVIPYPVERQVHTLIVLGGGATGQHTDWLPEFHNITYCVPFHIPMRAMLRQEYQSVLLQNGCCYSFNKSVDHGVDVPDTVKTYSAFIVIDIMTEKALKDKCLNGFRL